MPGSTVLDILPPEQEWMLAEVRRARHGSWLCRKVNNNSLLFTMSGIVLTRMFQPMGEFINFATVGHELWAHYEG